MEQVTPIARLTGEGLVLVVPASSLHRTLADFVTAWRADPGGTPIAGGSAGGADQILAVQIAKESGIDPKSVNYVAFPAAASRWPRCSAARSRPGAGRRRRTDQLARCGGSAGAARGSQVAAGRRRYEGTRSATWQQTVRQRGWEDQFLPAAAFDAFLDAERQRVWQILIDIDLIEGG